MTSLSLFTHPLYLLTASILVLFMGPLLHALFKGSTIVRDIIDGFTLIVIVLLVGMHILPHTIEDIGFLAIIMLLIGLFLPSLFEKLKNHIASKVHFAAIFIVMTGLALHAFTDGVALIAPAVIHSVDGLHTHSMLPVAVVLHRLPVGLAIWTLLRPVYGTDRALIMLFVISIATIFGFSSGTLLVTTVEHQPFGFIEALVAGLLLHVMFHRHDPHEKKSHTHHDGKSKPRFDVKWASGLGALLGFGLIFAIQNPFAHSHAGHHESMVFWNLAMVSAPALVVAYLCSGFINTFLPQSTVTWMQKGNEMKQAVRGLLFGLPLPICSCGVVPIYRSLFKKGIPLSAGITFFIATPELGLDAILITIPLLGTQFTAIRLIAATIVALLVGIIIGFFFSKKDKIKKQQDNKENQDDSLNIKSVSDFFHKLKTGMWIGLVDMVDHTAPWILFGLGIAAAVQPYLENTNLLLNIPSYLQVPLFAILGMPIYICASGITPFVAVLIYNGVSPGAAIAFMLTGPATNITTFGILTQLHGRKLAATFAILIVTISIGLGYLINLIHIDLPQAHLLTKPIHYYHYTTFFFIVLVIIYAFSLLRCGPQAWAKKIISDDIPQIDEEEKHGCCH